MIGIMTWRCQWDGCDQSAIDGTIEAGPFRLRWPASVSWKAPAVSCRYKVSAIKDGEPGGNSI